LYHTLLKKSIVFSKKYKNYKFYMNIPKITIKGTE